RTLRVCKYAKLKVTRTQSLARPTQIFFSPVTFTVTICYKYIVFTMYMWHFTSTLPVPRGAAEISQITKFVNRYKFRESMYFFHYVPRTQWFRLRIHRRIINKCLSFYRQLFDISLTICAFFYNSSISVMIRIYERFLILIIKPIDIGERRAWVCRRAWVRSPLGEFSRFDFSPGVIEPVPEVERVPLKKEDPGYVISLRSGKKTPITVRAGSDRITISRSPRRGLTRLAIDETQHSHDEVRSENHTHKRAPDAEAKAQLERMMAPKATTTLTR
ncbi:unnamed protein product, partial [Trichogramma brassicae]